MNTLTKVTVKTGLIQSALMAILFAKGNLDDIFIQLLLVSLLAHSMIFTLFTREITSLLIQEKHVEFWFEIALATLFAIFCAVIYIQIQTDLSEGIITPNADIASFALLVVITSFSITILCFFMHINNNEELKSEIRSDLISDGHLLA
jgi:hypothetical protein